MVECEVHVEAAARLKRRSHNPLVGRETNSSVVRDWIKVGVRVVVMVMVRVEVRLSLVRVRVKVKAVTKVKAMVRMVSIRQPRLVLELVQPEHLHRRRSSPTQQTQQS